MTQNLAAVEELKNLCTGRQVTFVFAAKDMNHNGAVVLREFLLSEFG